MTRAPCPRLALLPSLSSPRLIRRIRIPLPASSGVAMHCMHSKRWTYSSGGERTARQQRKGRQCDESRRERARASDRSWNLRLGDPRRRTRRSLLFATGLAGRAWKHIRANGQPGTLQLPHLNNSTCYCPLSWLNSCGRTMRNVAFAIPPAQRRRIFRRSLSASLLLQGEATLGKNGV